MAKSTETSTTRSRFAAGVLVLAGLFLLSDGLAAESMVAQRRAIAPSYDVLKRNARDRRSIPVLVRFSVDPPDGRSHTQRREAGRQRLGTAMARNNMRAFAEFRRTGMSAYFVDERQLDELLDSGFVVGAWESKLREPHLQQSNSLINMSVARSFGLNGNGSTVVVVDTGIDAVHTTFDSRVVWEACYSTNWRTYSATNLCPTGGNANATQYFESGPGAAALTKCTDVDCFHGTHVASIAAGSNSTYTGMAPQAEIIAIQVFSRFDDDDYCGSGRSPCILTFDHDQLSALEYVADLAATHTIAAVNMSLGGGAYTADCDWDSSFPPAIAALEALDIVVAASSGNDGYTNGMGHPACLDKVVSVGSVHDTTDQVSSFTNSADFLDVLAPGQPITAAYPGGGWATASGTSMSSPHIAGALALMKAADSSLTYAQMNALLISTGVPVLDTGNNLTFPRLDAGAIATALSMGLAGDANDDGKVDVADWLLVKRHVGGNLTLDAAAILRCDLHPAGSPDGVLGIADALLLEQMLIGN